MINRLLASDMAEDNPLWLVVLCDLMTNLMLFFLILFSFTRQDDMERKKIMQGLQEGFKGKQQTEAEQRAEGVLTKLEEEQAISQIERLIAQKRLQGGLEVTDEKIALQMPNPALFESGRSGIEPAVAKDLEAMTLILVKLKNDVIVEGHTDSRPLSAKSPFRSNWHLSAARADSVIRFFIQNGLAASRFIAAGYGEMKPAAPNDTEEGRAKNRRIEIHVIRRR
ncbi:MAG: flagellar motor protein MotB [Elusimicrobia bacterium]|nr:flagellar motor protein MotB [Elusimicrobiota bacterium]